MSVSDSSGNHAADLRVDYATARDLAVVLHDLAWLLPRTVGLEAASRDPLPQSELEVMRLLVRRPGLSVNDVARELGLQASNASTAIRLLIARGALERRADLADGRVARLYPTPDAYAARERRELSWGEALAPSWTAWDRLNGGSWPPPRPHCGCSRTGWRATRPPVLAPGTDR